LFDALDDLLFDALDELLFACGEWDALVMSCTRNYSHTVRDFESYFTSTPL
jgi:hypothetical protein